MDAKGAEIDAAKMRVKWARAKAAFIGGRLLIVRLSLCFLPLAAALLSFGSFEMVIPLFEKKMTFSIIGLFSFFTDGTLAYLSALKSSEIAGIYAKHAVNIFFGLSAVVGFALLAFLLQLLCFISIKKMTAILTAVSASGILATAWVLVAVHNFSTVTASTIFTVANGYGGFAVIFAFALACALNMAIMKKGVKIKYHEGDLYRVEMGKKLKRGEVTFDDLPQPVYPPAEQVHTNAAETGQRTNGEVRPYE